MSWTISSNAWLMVCIAVRCVTSSHTQAGQMCGTTWSRNTFQTALCTAARRVAMWPTLSRHISRTSRRNVWKQICSKLRSLIFVISSSVKLSPITTIHCHQEINHNYWCWCLKLSEEHVINWKISTFFSSNFVLVYLYGERKKAFWILYSSEL